MTQSNESFPISFIKENSIAIIFMGLLAYVVITNLFSESESEQKTASVKEEMKKNQEEVEKIRAA